MDQQTQDLRNQLGVLAEDARALMGATADVAGQKASEARERLTAALAKAKETCGRVRDQVVDQGKVVDQSVRQHPYEIIGVALGLGVLVGCLLCRRCRTEVDRSPQRQ